MFLGSSILYIYPVGWDTLNILEDEMNKTLQIDVAEVERLWKIGRTADDIAITVGCSKSYVYQLVQHNGWKHKDKKKSKYLDGITRLAAEGKMASEIAVELNCSIQNVHGLAKLHQIKLKSSGLGRPTKESIVKQEYDKTTARKYAKSDGPMNHERCALIRYVWGVSACASDKVCKQQKNCARRHIFVDEYVDYKSYLLKGEQS